MRSAIVVCLLVALSAGDARANDRSVALAPIAIRGSDNTETLSASIRRAIERAALERNVTFSTLESGTCPDRDDHCLDQVRIDKTVDVLFALEVEVTGTSYRLSSVKYDSDGALRKDAFCTACAVTELETEVTILFLDAIKRNETKPAAPDHGSVMAAASPASTPATTVVQTTAGDARPYRQWKWVTAGGAGALIVTGAILIAIDGPTCNDGPRVRCENIRSSQEMGIVTTGLGVAAAAAAAWMFLQDRDAQRTQPLVQLRPGGATIGASWRF